MFWLAGTNFGTWGNLVEIVRLAGEVGLLALALTPVIITGGIDLSVGALMGLTAVVFGLTWRDAGLPVWVAAAVALATGGAGGALNALLIARFSLPPLLVTLGTLSLFRGLAEGITGGADFVSGFPHAFLWIGQSVSGGVPPQAIALLVAALAFAHLLHRTIHGRSWYAIGSSAEGARYAGIPVGRRLALTLRALRVRRGMRRAPVRRANRAGQGGRGHRVRAAWPLPPSCSAARRSAAAAARSAARCSASRVS